MRAPWRGTDRAAGAFRAAVLPDTARAWRSAEWCAIDLELTGLDPRRDEIIAIGAVPVRDGRAMLGEAYYSLARPDQAPGRRSIVIHKLREADLVGAPELDHALDGLFAVLAGCRPVFHTAWVEEAFLGRALRRRGVRLSEAADTEVLGRRWLAARGAPVPRHLGLAELAAALGFVPDAPHHALGDALTTAAAFIALASLLDRAAPQTVGSLLTTEAAPTPRARRMGPVS